MNAIDPRSTLDTPPPGNYHSYGGDPYAEYDPVQRAIEFNDHRRKLDEEADARRAHHDRMRSEEMYGPLDGEDDNDDGGFDEFCRAAVDVAQGTWLVVGAFVFGFLALFGLGVWALLR